MKFINKSTVLAFLTGAAVTLLITLCIFFVFLRENNSAETAATPSQAVSSVASSSAASSSSNILSDQSSSTASNSAASNSAASNSAASNSAASSSSEASSKAASSKPVSSASSATKPPAKLPQKPPAAKPDTGTTQKPKDFRVVGYYPSWSPKQTDKIRYDVLTHIIYAFAIPTSDGGLMPLENGDTAKKIISTAHDNGAKVLLAVGGWSYKDVILEPTFKEATSTDEKLKRFGDAILDMCDKYGFDGIDLDWEYPRIEDGTWQRYESLMLYLSEKLHAKGKLLTSAVICGVTPDGYDIPVAMAQSQKVLEAVDWVNVMAYDGGEGDRHSSYDFAVNCSNYWLKTRGMPKEKVVLGVPFYSHTGWKSYNAILSQDKNAWNSDTSITDGITTHYNGQATIKKKTKFAKESLGGIMVWEITQDTSDKDKSLFTAIKQALT